MHTLSKYTFFVLVLLGFSSCDSLQKTDLVRSEPITVVKGDTLIYQMYLTGLHEFRYEFNLVNNLDTTGVFKTSFTDEAGNEARMEIEPGQNHIKIILDKPVDHQNKTINGVTYELVGTR